MASLNPSPPEAELEKGWQACDFKVAKKQVGMGGHKAGRVDWGEWEGENYLKYP